MANPVLNRVPIKNLEIDLPNVMLIGLLIAKQEHRRIQLHNYQNEAIDTEERAVWNFTLRDSPIDYINVTFWGKADIVCQMDAVISIGSIVEITNPRVALRNSHDVGEQYRPAVTSPFHLTVNHGNGNIQRVRDYCVEPLTQLLALPTKPMFNYTTIDYIFSNIHQINGCLFDLLVAVRQVGDLRIVQTAKGLKEVRKILVFDRTNPAMTISIWNTEYNARAITWKPRETVLFITDCKVQYETFSNSPTGTPSMKTIITENPNGTEANLLKEYAKNAQLHSSTTLDQLIGLVPEASTIKTVMNIRQIQQKIDQINDANSAKFEDNQFAIILYAYITKFDIDGTSKVFSIRCSLCKSLIYETENCPNPVCLSNTSNKIMELDKSFDMRIQVSDRTGSLPNCRLSGKTADTVLFCTPSIFAAKTEEEKAEIKWNYLFEFCELRLVIFLKNKNPFITILSCTLADVPES